MYLILRLIAKGDIDRALAARDEYVKFGQKIAQNRAFARAAIDALSIVDPEVRSRKFIAWWSLAPLHEYPEQVELACSKILNHPFDIPLLMDFCILCAKSGFARTIERSRLLPHIFRYGHPDATTAFLVKLEHEAKESCTDESPDDWMSMRNLAIRAHLTAGRKKIARQLYDGAVANNFRIEPEILKVLEANTSAEALPRADTSTWQLHSRTPKDPHRSISALARELRILRQIAITRERPQNFERFLAEFIQAYELLGRESRAIRMLREKVFRKGTYFIRSRWATGEQLAYSWNKKPLAVLRTYMNYFLSDSILAAESRRILSYWRLRQKNWTSKRWKVDWKLSQKPVKVEWKIWPSRPCMSMAWKAVLQLSSKHEITRLYALLLQHVEQSRMAPDKLSPGMATTSDLDKADKQYYDPSSHFVAIPPVIFPDQYYFHHFVVAFAARCAPRQGFQVIKDMERLGFTPSKESYGALAGAYARSGDLRRVLRILDFIDRDSRDSPPSRTLLATYNSVLRGFMDARMYHEARTIHRLMQDRGCFKGRDKRTRTVVHKLSWYEKGKYDKQLFRQRKVVLVNGRQLVIDENRAEWLKELE
ncbi:hypothetical protein ACEPAH_1517 [Sanghuangporus vaninii]